ncbi:hypothetical protein VB005_04517 [Metarhizium brunneum]
MATKNVLIIGSNRGIGLQLTKAFLRQSYDVFATTRPESRLNSSFRDLEETGATILELDFLDEKSIASAARAYGNKPLDVLINVGGNHASPPPGAGVIPHKQLGLPQSPKPWKDQKSSLVLERLRAMTIGPYLTMTEFLPQLELATNPKVINISSSFGSISTNTFGTCLAYRTAKCALNQVSVTLAREWESEGRKTTITYVEPGFLSTGLTGWDGEDDMETCITGLMKIISSISHEYNGAFLKWDGSKISF